MRVGGISRNKSAVKVAMDRRYKGLLTGWSSDTGSNRGGIEETQEHGSCGSER